jgi:hypothetical protein
MEHFRLGLQLDSRSSRRVCWDRQAGRVPELWYSWNRPLVPVAAYRVFTITGAPDNSTGEHSLNDLRDPRRWNTVLH